jgi:hypothetical protein
MFAPGQVKILDSQPAIQLRYLAVSAAHTAVHKSQGTEERDTELENFQSNNMHQVHLYMHCNKRIVLFYSEISWYAHCVRHSINTVRAECSLMDVQWKLYSCEATQNILPRCSDYMASAR